MMMIPETTMSLTPTMIPDEAAVTEPELPQPQVAEVPKRGSAAEICLEDWIAATQSCCGADSET